MEIIYRLDFLFNYWIKELDLIINLIFVSGFFCPQSYLKKSGFSV